MKNYFTFLKNNILSISLTILVNSIIIKPFAQNTSSFCVIELFTSEGCSSCPSGDNMMNNAVNLTDDLENNNLYLSMHLVLWDYLGWTDPYGNQAHDDLFFGYYNGGNGISFAGGSSFGTPLFVRNGEQGRNYSTQVQSKTATAFVDLSFNNLTEDQLSVNYNLSGELQNAEVRFFLVERGLTNHVTAGENAGLTLDHENVVRDMEVLSTSPTNGTFTFSVPVDADLEKMRVMAYIRKTTSSPWSREIIGANKGFKVGDFVNLQEINAYIESNIYPNPFSEEIQILCAEEMKCIKISNQMGQIVLSANPHSFSETLVLTELENGIYYVQIETERGILVKKIKK